MSNSVKKISIVIIAIVMIMSALTGCSGNQASNENTKPVTQPQTETGKSEAPKEPVKIEFWYGLGGKLGENVERFIKEFNESQNEVIVVGVQQGNYTETYQKLQAAIAAKKVPAAVLLGNDTMTALANKGILAPMDGFIEQYPNFNIADFVPSFYQQGTIAGHQYALPLYGTTQVLYYRKDVFNEQGISPDVLNQWETLAEAAAKIKEEKGIYGWMPMWGSDNLIDAALSRGAKYLSEDGKEVLIDSPEWIETWEFFRKAIHEDKTMAIQHGGQGWEYWYKTIDDVIQGRAAGYTGSSGDQGDLDFTIVAAHPQPGWEGHEPAPHAEALVASIPALASKEEQEAAFKFFAFFTGTEKTADWSMNTGYIAVRMSARENPEFKKYAEKNPQILVPLTQAQSATPPFIDPTNGKIFDALSKAADRVEIEGVSAEIALKDAKKEAQNELDKVLKK